MTTRRTPQGRGNRLLAQLAPAVLEELAPHLKTVSLKAKQVIFRAHTSLDVVYFQITCVISLLTHLKTGETPEVGLVGRDGMGSISVFPGVNTMPCDGVVLIPGAAYGVHPIEERCVRWPLMTHDLVDNDEFPLTQDVLAMMLGVRRPSVTIVARALQRAGLIDYGRGRVKILDRRGIEAASCECYWLMREEQRRLFDY